MVPIFNEGLIPDIKNEMIKQSWLSMGDAFDKADELEKHTEQRALSAAKINETSVDYMGNTSNHDSNPNLRNQSQGRGGRSQNHQRRGYNQTSNQQRYNYNASPKATYNTQNTSTKPQPASTSYRGNNQRGKGTFPSHRGVTCRYCLKLDHFAKYCRGRIAKGHAIPVADIKDGLYNERYCGTNDPKEIENIVQSCKSKN
jgi:hypothetical protein